MSYSLVPWKRQLLLDRSPISTLLDPRFAPPTSQLSPGNCCSPPGLPLGLACVLSHFSHAWLFVTPWTVAHQAPLSRGFSRQECWSGLPFHSPGDPPSSGIKPTSLILPALAGRSFTTSANWEALTLGHLLPTLQDGFSAETAHAHLSHDAVFVACSWPWWCLHYKSQQMLHICVRYLPGEWREPLKVCLPQALAVSSSNRGHCLGQSHMAGRAGLHPALSSSLECPVDALSGCWGWNPSPCRAGRQRRHQTSQKGQVVLQVLDFTEPFGAPICSWGGPVCESQAHALWISIN